MYRQTPTVWSAEQMIDPLGIAKTFMGVGRASDGYRVFLARCALELKHAPDSALLRLTTDGKHQLWINGRRVARGPVRCDPIFQRYDTHDVARCLHAGRNIIGLIIRVEGRDTAQYQRVRGHWHESFGEGALWAELEVDGKIISDFPANWLFQNCPAWTGDTPVGNSSLGHLEHFDGRLFPEDWLTPDFDDSGWAESQILSTGGGGPEAPFGGMKVEPFPTLLPRIAAAPVEQKIIPSYVHWTARQEASGAPFESAVYEEGLTPIEAQDVADAVLNGGCWTVPAGEGDFAVLVAFDRVHAGYPVIDIDAVGGEIIDIAVSERLPGEFEAGGLDEQSRPVRRPSHHGSDANVVRFIAKPGRQKLEKFAWVGVRWLHVVIRGATPQTSICSVKSVEAFQPWQPVGIIESEDAFFNWIWQAGSDTLRACAIDAWIDCPTREQRQWLGDVAVEFPAAWALFGPQIAPLNRQFLIQAAESQRPDGLLQMFAPGDHAVNALLIPDWALQWIAVLEDHIMRTGEVELLETLLPVALRVLGWFRSHIGPNGLICDTPFWTFFDWAGLGREHEAIATNLLYKGSLDRVARLSRLARNAGDASRLFAEAASLSEAIGERAWDEARGVFVDMVHPTKGRLPRTSQHVNALAILYDVAPSKNWKRMMAWVADPARLKSTTAPMVVPDGETLDPENDCVKANTFFGHFVAEAFSKAGRADLAFALMRDRFEPMFNLGATTIWEAHRPTASLCHGFSATGIHILATAAFGLAPGAPGFELVSLSPQIVPGLQSLKVSYPIDEDTIMSLTYTSAGDGTVIKIRGIDPLRLKLDTHLGWIVGTCDDDALTIKAGLKAE